MLIENIRSDFNNRDKRLEQRVSDLEMVLSEVLNALNVDLNMLDLGNVSQLGQEQIKTLVIPDVLKEINSRVIVSTTAPTTYTSCDKIGTLYLYIHNETSSSKTVDLYMYMGKVGSQQRVNCWGAIGSYNFTT